MNINQVKMATDINYGDIDNLQDLNGVTINEIERRARPGAEADSGFLGQSESFIEILKADWQTVYDMGTTHIELAKQIKAISTEAFTNSDGSSFYKIYTPSINGYDIRCIDTVTFKVAAISFLVTIVAAAILTPWALLGLIPTAFFITQAVNKKQILHIKPEFHRGKQTDIFDPALNERNGWSRQIVITNILNRKSVTIGEGVINYIEKYGFYEGGGDQNRYRVDPKRLVTILTGVSQ